LSLSAPCFRRAACVGRRVDGRERMGEASRVKCGDESEMEMERRWRR
jgi:hypothetical protein